VYMLWMVFGSCFVCSILRQLLKTTSGLQYCAIGLRIHNNGCGCGYPGYFKYMYLIFFCFLFFSCSLVCGRLIHVASRIDIVVHPIDKSCYVGLSPSSFLSSDGNTSTCILTLVALLWSCLERLSEPLLSLKCTHDKRVIICVCRFESE